MPIYQNKLYSDRWGWLSVASVKKLKYKHQSEFCTIVLCSHQMQSKFFTWCDDIKNKKNDTIFMQLEKLQLKREICVTLCRERLSVSRFSRRHWHPERQIFPGCVWTWINTNDPAVKLMRVMQGENLLRLRCEHNIRTRTNNYK